jgi:hypothetical protein
MLELFHDVCASTTTANPWMNQVHRQNVVHFFHVMSGLQKRGFEEFGNKLPKIFVSFLSLLLGLLD